MSISKTLNHLYSNARMELLLLLLGPLLFIFYITHLSNVISNYAANHHLYADDIRLLLTFSALIYFITKL